MARLQKAAGADTAAAAPLRGKRKLDEDNEDAIPANGGAGSSMKRQDVADGEDDHMDAAAIARLLAEADKAEVCALPSRVPWIVIHYCSMAAAIAGHDVGPHHSKADAGIVGAQNQ